MLPAAPAWARGSCEQPAGGPAPPENAKDIIVIYEGDAEEWALYLSEVFSHVVKMEATLLYCLENCSLRDLDLLNLSSYKCKLLILSNSLLENLSPKKGQFLKNILFSSESVVTLLCGMKSSDQFYKLLNISRSRWEISTEQGPEEYISVIESIIFGGSADYLEITVPPDLRKEQSGQTNERKEAGEFLEASGSTIPQAVVLPAEIPCENPGEIFIILRDEVTSDAVEVEFTSNSKCIRTQPALWNKSVWSMKALDFPAGSVNVDVYVDGIIKATAEIKYYTTQKAMKCLLGAAGPRDDVYQSDIDKLDDILTSTFKHEIPYYEFQSLQTEICPQKEHSYFKELPTLLHCAAKFGLKNLAVHLLQCSGATRASKIKNLEGSDPAHIAERHGHKELKKIFEDFSIQEVSRDNEQENHYEESITSFSTCFPTVQSPALHHKSWPYRQKAEEAKGNEMAEEEKEHESGMEAEHSPPEVDSESENQYDDLYVFIPGDNPEDNSQEPLVCPRPPLPPPRPVTTAFQPEKPHFPVQGKLLEGQMERSQSWCDFSARYETGSDSEEEKKEDEKGREEEEDPYTFAEIDDSEYDTILASRSIKKKAGSRSFIMNRPPAPTPRPTSIPPKEETTPYIAQVFQQKAARRQSDNDKFHGPKKQVVIKTLLMKTPFSHIVDRGRMESQTFSTVRNCLAAGQEELILLQEKVKNGKLSMDEALEKFKHWQMGKTGLEIIQQEKLRQLRDCIVGKRPEEENVYNKLTIVHHPNGNESAHSESMLHNIPFGSKLPARPQVEKDFGFCCRKDH
ncbi:B-cell scaffold protein with ankyrin repeats isoform X2 [Ovis canadensis]|uniref:B-cell scaffold protein with ankyrin repeats isoform X2 n=1 Tax=Ovis canadensis TaxID=37174 RepID=UPI0037519B2D